MNRRLTILVVDDDLNQAKLLAEALNRLGHSAKACSAAEEALETIREQMVHLVITDLRMPKKDGLAFLKTLKELDPDIEVLLITAYASVSSAVDAMRLGALDYMEKPIDVNMMAAKIAGIEERAALRAENRSLRAQLDRVIPGPLLIGKSPTFRSTLEQVKLAATSDATVLLLGESGTGKEVLARFLHNSSKRAKGPFAPINCGAIHENLVESEFFGHVKGAFTGADKPRPGRIEDAEGGTLFLDEIGELPLTLQPKLLRVIQEGEFCRLGANKVQHANVRWVAATHRDLFSLVKEGKFREDLYYRLAVLPIKIPPLRERRDDISELITHFLSKRAAFYKKPVKLVTPEALEALGAYPWPGNIRELENTLERLFLLVPGNTIDLGDLPREFGETVELPMPQNSTGSLVTRVDLLEQQCIQEALQAARGNQSEAARRLGIHERTLRYKMRKLGIRSATSF